nr:MAG TPA: hypothetical protein [Caudoviricetes sp.]
MGAVLHLRWKPSDFANLPQNEKAFVIACLGELAKANAKNK